MTPPIDLDADAALVLPDPPPVPQRRPLPLLGAAVPVAGALVLWLVTGSAALLWFAALGPLIAAASALDGRRAVRRAARRAAAVQATARAVIDDAVSARHAVERRGRWAKTPDAAALMCSPDRVWRGTAGQAPALVVGRGDDRSAVRVSGGDGSEQSRALRQRAMVLRDSPITVPVDAGVAVIGPDIVARAVARALIAQACLLLPPEELTVLGDGESWTDDLPHRSGGGARVLELGRQASAPAIVALRPDDPVPSRCAAVLRLKGADAGVLHYEDAAIAVQTEALGAEQARGVAEALAHRAERLRRGSASDVVAFSELPRSEGDARSLSAVIGRVGRQLLEVDLVADGPHAVVAGMTGAGKSELLVTWVAALCATRSPADVTFLLADFKGGTAFEVLTALPHVVGVVTDLDGRSAHRALDSLRAEVRHREAELVRAGTRDVAATTLPRLVVVVDEFAALIGAHPELQAVFTDLAARGRALGIHLVLGTQRVTGVVRDALLANCPLRISLRVSESVDSRAVVGTDDAARLPGGLEGRGRAIVRRAADSVPSTARIALTSLADVAAIASSAPRLDLRRPWLPELPGILPVDDPRLRRGDASQIVLGLGDRPELQRQDPALLPRGWRTLVATGGPGAGRTTALETIASQVPAGSRCWVPRDPEAAWDLLEALEREPGPVALIVADDLDLQLARYPLDYQQALAQRWERLIRQAGDHSPRVAASLRHAGGPAGRLLDLFEHRLELGPDGFSAGGGRSSSSPSATPPGRGRFDGTSVQIARSALETPASWPAESPRAWAPDEVVSGVVVRPGPARARYGEVAAARGVRVVSLEDHAGESVSMIAPRSLLIGDADGWQRSWRTLAAVREQGQLLVDAACSADLRMLTGLRELPPYCLPIPGRAWLLRPGRDLCRVQLAESAPAAGSRRARRMSDHGAEGRPAATVAHARRGKG